MLQNPCNLGTHHHFRSAQCQHTYVNPCSGDLLSDEIQFLAVFEAIKRDSHMSRLCVYHSSAPMSWGPTTTLTLKRRSIPLLRWVIGEDCVQGGLLVSMCFADGVAGSRRCTELSEEADDIGIRYLSSPSAQDGFQAIP